MHGCMHVTRQVHDGWQLEYMWTSPAKHPRVLLPALSTVQHSTCSCTLHACRARVHSTGIGLRAALAARSYRKEVILMATDSQRMLQPMQVSARLSWLHARGLG